MGEMGKRLDLRDGWKPDCRGGFVSMENPDGFEISFQNDLKTLAESKRCLFCHRVWKTLWDFFVTLPYELINDVNKRQEYGQEGALCPFHLWQLASLASPACLSLILAEMAHRTSLRWRELMNRDQKLMNISEMPFNAPGNCLICSYANQVEREYLDYFGRGLATREGFAAYEKSEGFCLRHATLLIEVMDDEHSKLMIKHAAQHLSELSQNLLSFFHKKEIHRRDLLQPDEEYAVSRAMVQLGGIRYLHYLLTTP
jgi:hypothetical protein